jgi:hypothetical protein
MIAAKILGYYWIDPPTWHLLKPLLFYSGAFQVVGRQNPTETDEDTKIIVSIKEEQFHHITVFVVTKLITLQHNLSVLFRNFGVGKIYCCRCVPSI